ncbi:MAG: nucleotidyltransferase family protein [Cyanobacteria bacterium P01_H01_bin.121]
MQCQDVLQIVRNHQLQLEALGVKSLDVFGSVARNQAKVDSDVDFLVEFSRPVGFFGLFEVQHYLESILNRAVDLGTVKALKAHLQEPILQDRVRVF